MSDSIKELLRINFNDFDNLDTRNKIMSADVAVWVKIEAPSQVKTCRLFLRYFAGTGFREIELDHLNHALGTPALLSARAQLPVELQQMSFSLCVEIEGSDYKVDTVHFLPLRLKQEKTKSQSLYAA